MSNSSEFADTFERSQIRYTTMDFWRSGNGVYGLVEESAQEEEEAATLGGLEEEEEEEGGSRRCLRQHVLGAWTKAKEIYCFAPCIYGISALRPIYIPSDEAARNARTAIPNNCFWKCERASLLTTLSLLFFFFLSFEERRDRLSKTNEENVASRIISSSFSNAIASLFLILARFHPSKGR